MGNKISYEKVSNKEKYGYGAGAVGKDMCYALVGSFFMNYCTDNVGISALFMGVLFFFARIWDAINDPMMGIIVDNTKNKFGKYRTWILAGSLSNAVLLVLLFLNPSWFTESYVAKCVYIAVLYIMWGMTYTLVDVPYWAFASGISPDPEVRNQVSTIPRVFAGLGQGSVQILTITIVSALGVGFMDKGYFRWACIIAIIFVVFCIVCICCIKERPIATRKESVTFKEAFRTLKNNDQLMYLVLCLILINMAMNLAVSSAVYYFKYVWGDMNLYSIFAAVIAVSVFIGMVIYPAVAKKFDKKKLFLYGTLIPAVAFAIMAVVSNTLMNLPVMQRMVCVLIPAFILCHGSGIINVATTVTIADTVDYGEWKLGYRSEGVVFSMQTFMVKFATALVGLITGVGLSISGFDLTNALTDNVKSDEALQIAIKTLQESGTLDNVKAMLNVLLFVLPPILLVLAAIIFAKKYKLDNKRMEEISSDLLARRAELSDK